MKLLFSNDWLERTIRSDPDESAEVGSSLISRYEDNIAGDDFEDDNLATLTDSTVVPMRVALGVLVRSLRLRDGLSMELLAQCADVAEDELAMVEHNPNYTASPRLIFQLSHYFNVPLSKLSQLAGTTHAVNRRLYNTSLKYAARSDDLSSLTDGQREVLDEFVQVLIQAGGN